MVEKLPRSAARSRCAASRSGIEAAVTTTASSRPFTSTAMCRWTPFVLLAPSQPRLDRGTVSAAGTVCESMIAAVGHRSRPARTRSRSRSASRMRCHPPLRVQRAKTAYTVAAGGNSTGSCRATRYHRARCAGWRPLPHGGNASRVVRRGLPCCPAPATAVRGSPTVRRSPTTSTPRNPVRPPAWGRARRARR